MSTEFFAEMRRRLAAKNPAYLDGPVTSSTAPSSAIPDCRYRGEVTGQTVTCPTCSGRVELKLYSCSVHVACTLGKKAEGFACCKTCPDRRDPLVSVTVPTPPPYTGKIRSGMVVVTGAVGKEHERILAVTEPYTRAFAERIGADFVRVNWPGHSDLPASMKFMFGSVAKVYSRSMWVDADVLLRPGCVNPFNYSGDGVAGFDELPVHLNNPKYRALDDARQLREYVGLPVGQPPFHLNTGVLVVTGSAWGALLPPAVPIPVYHHSVQDWINGTVWEGACLVTRLSMTCNWQRWIDPGFRNALPQAVLHWSGPIEPDEKLAQIRDFARRYPL